MEKEEMDLLRKQVKSRMNDFIKRINQLIINNCSDLSLNEIEQKISRKIISPNPSPKHPKYVPYFKEVVIMYEILACYKYYAPTYYNELWLLYGYEDNNSQDDFVTRFDKFKDYAISILSIPEDDIIVFEENIYNGYNILTSQRITEFANVFAGVNKLKTLLKLKDLNTAWLLSGEGDMFEKTEN